MSEKKEDQEWLEELDDFERSMLGIGEETYYNYRCSRCKYEQQVPDFVVDELAAYDELSPGCGRAGPFGDPGGASRYSRSQAPEAGSAGQEVPGQAGGPFRQGADEERVPQLTEIKALLADVVNRAGGGKMSGKPSEYGRYDLPVW